VANGEISRFYDKKFHADFSNKIIGGNVLTGGCLQEEILFAIKPECLVSLLFCSVMTNNEAIVISGAEQFSAFTGYSTTFTWAGDFRNCTPKNTKLDCIDNHIIAIDALLTLEGETDFAKIISRDMAKVYIGLCNPEQFVPEEKEHWFVSGNWGCGAFGGDPELKSCQQIIGASEAGVNIIYCTFGKQSFEIKFKKFLEFLEMNSVTCGELATVLMGGFGGSKSVFEFVQKKISEMRAITQ